MFRVIALLCFAAAAPAQNPSAEEQIRAEIERQAEAWNRGDVRSFMESYDKAAATTFVSAAGVIRGYEQVLARYLNSYPAREAMGRLAFAEIEVHLLSADSAWVLGRFDLKRSAAAGGDKSGFFTLIWRKTPGGWRIVLDHTS